MDARKEVGLNTTNTTITTLRGIPEGLHWKIMEESLKRKKANKPNQTINDIYLELIQASITNFSWSK